jgi:hypothetical protein
VRKSTAIKRFTVSLDNEHYEQLWRLGKEHQPPLSLQYVSRYTLQRFLDENKGKRLSIKFGEDS